MRKQVSELEGAALDWAVAEASGRTPQLWDYSGFHVIGVDGVYPGSDPWEVSSDWEQGGPLIEKHGVTILKYDKEVLDRNPDTKPWCAAADGKDICVDELEGPTALIAAMRAIVASKLGPEVDIPEALCP